MSVIRTEENFDDDDSVEDEDEIDVENNVQEENNSETEETERVVMAPTNLKRKDKTCQKNMSAFELKLVNFLEGNQVPTSTLDCEDADKVFFLSLVPKFKTLPEDLKIDGQIQILNIIKNLKNQESLLLNQNLSQPSNYNQPVPSQNYKSHSPHSSYYQPSTSNPIFPQSNSYNSQLQSPASNFHSFQFQTPSHSQPTIPNSNYESLHKN